MKTITLIDTWWKRLLIALLFSKIIAEAFAALSFVHIRINPLLIIVILYFVLTNSYNAQLRQSKP